MSKYLSNVIKEMNDYGNMGLPDGEGSMGMGSQAPTGKLKDAFKMQQLKTNQMLRRRSQAEEEEDRGMGGPDDMSAQADLDGMGDEGSMDGEMGDEMSMGDEEGMDGMDGEMGSMDGEMGDEEGMDDEMGTEDDVAQLQQFFTDNPEPSDQDISQYADENGMDLGGMRSAVYALIGSLIQQSGGDGSAGEEFDWLGGGDSALGTDGEDDGMGDEEGMGDEMDSMDDGSMDGMEDDGETSEMDFSVPGDTGERPAKKEFEEKRYGRRSSDRQYR